MKISTLRIKNHLQFQDIKLDFTDLHGKPLNKICFIGRNGTGKSTLLNVLNQLLNNHLEGIDIPFFYVKYSESNRSIILFSAHHIRRYNYYFTSEIENETDWFERLTASTDVQNEVKKFKKYIIQYAQVQDTIGEIRLKDCASDLLIYSPPESFQNTYMQVDDIPDTNLNSALALFKSFPYHHLVSDQNVQEFWRLLIYLVKKRENEREEFENKPENLDKTKKQLIKEFDNKNPKILNKIADLWNKILASAGLEFDLENANNPIQLDDNLKAYIRLKSTKQRINYNQLSTGIRNFIFRVGHIYSLYFNREIKNGFLLLDEPENSLFPDFLFDLIETYQEIVFDKNRENNTQLFVSTHNPIIAAQFEPYERIILEWNDTGFVDAFKGEAPIGDDPNDLLSKDFKLKNLMGKKGREMWSLYMELRKKLIISKNEQKKKELISQINKIGQLYNFED